MVLSSCPSATNVITLNDMLGVSAQYAFKMSSEFQHLTWCNAWSSIVKYLDLACQVLIAISVVIKG